jgi:hypothetical protein
MSMAEVVTVNIYVVRNHAKGPRINALIVAPSHGLFLTCRREKYTVIKQYCTEHIVNERVPNAKSLLGIVAFDNECKSPFALVPCCKTTASSCTVLAPPLS